MADSQAPGPGHNTAAESLRGYVARIESAEEDIADLNTVKTSVYREARAAGFDGKALREVVKRRRRPAAEVADLDALVGVYLAALDGGALPVPAVEPVASPRARARARARGKKGEYGPADQANPAFDIPAKHRRREKKE